MILEWIQQGGPMMWPIVGLSVLGTMVILERAFFWIRHAWRVDSERRDRLNIRRGLPIEADVQSPDPVVRIASWLRLDQPRGQRLADEVIAEGARGVGALELFASISTTLGLFGTVIGVSLSFGAISSGDTETVLTGLSVALYTTVFGLLVHLYCGVFAAFFNFLHGRLEVSVLQMERPVLQEDSR